MKRAVVALAVLALLAAGGAVFLYMPRGPSGEPLALIDAYCADCHNAAEYAGELVLEGRAAADVHDETQVWEAVIEKLSGRLMPPAGEPRPEPEAVDELLGFLTTTIDRAAQEAPYPGAPVLRRLNRNEYANAVRDLLAVPVDATMLLPADDASGGFDNIANALSISPAHMQAYVSSAAKLSRLAVGDMTTSAAIMNYRPPRGLDQANHLEGMPFGTRGGMSVEHVFPLDGEYEITINRSRSLFQLSSVGGDQPTLVMLNGEIVRRLDRGDPDRFRISVSAGPQTLGATVLRTSRPEGVDDMYEVFALSPGINGISIMGPFDPAGPGDTPSRRRVFVCTPADASEEAPCAREILETLASRAFRRPVDTADPSLETLMSFYETGAEMRGFETGIQYALARILVDPQFLFLFEKEPPGLEAGEVYDIGDFELAARLALFLWSSIPDDELMAAAGAGRLTQPEVLEAQISRMLADERAGALVTNFASQWLLLRELDSVSPAAGDFDGNLRLAMRTETEMLFETIVREDRSVVDLLAADFTYADERLATHYGIPHVRGSRFRRVSLAGTQRRGLLGHGSILTATSAPNRTSPVTRGAWVLTNLLGTPPPEPPPGVDTNLDPTRSEGRPLTMRERLEQHRRDPNCAACHSIIDPIGFALENFDTTGRWRDTDAGRPVDAAGELWDGTPLAGPADLNAALLERRDLFVTAFAEKLLTYALGRLVDHRDMPAVRGVVRAAEAEDYRFSAFIRGVVRSVPFRKKMKPGERGGGE